LEETSKNLTQQINFLMNINTMVSKQRKNCLNLMETLDMQYKLKLTRP